MAWKLDDSRPIWPQLKEQLTMAIVSGQYPMGSPFPTVRDLAADAGVNRNTMQRALSELENDGLVITNRTAGRTVTTDKELIMKMKMETASTYIDEFVAQMNAIGFSTEEIIQVLKEKEAK
ncbi:MAG: GntR family transcriptional regulator [Eubacterium sp.]|nr:GntR family transcriptional regulator [Candidatus Colimonas fimequi]